MGRPPTSPRHRPAVEGPDAVDAVAGIVGCHRRAEQRIGPRRQEGEGVAEEGHIDLPGMARGAVVLLQLGHRASPSTWALLGSLYAQRHRSVKATTPVPGP